MKKMTLGVLGCTLVFTIINFINTTTEVVNPYKTIEIIKTLV